MKVYFFILIFDGGELGSNPIVIVGCVKFYWKDPHVHCVYPVGRST